SIKSSAEPLATPFEAESDALASAPATQSAPSLTSDATPKTAAAEVEQEAAVGTLDDAVVTEAPAAEDDQAANVDDEVAKADDVAKVDDAAKDDDVARAEVAKHDDA